jgi:hypothetical protein
MVKNLTQRAIDLIIRFSPAQTAWEDVELFVLKKMFATIKLNKYTGNVGYIIY